MRPTPPNRIKVKKKSLKLKLIGFPYFRKIREATMDQNKGPVAQHIALDCGRCPGEVQKQGLHAVVFSWNIFPASSDSWLRVSMRKRRCINI